MAYKSKIIVIVGPTASGKSELAAKIAKRFDGEIISADSRQVYRGLDIGTGKIPGKWKFLNILSNERSSTGRYVRGIITKRVFVYKGIPHYCIDFVSSRRVFTAAEYKKCGEEAISNITARGKIPIVVGGTGFYIDAFVKNISLPEVPPNLRLRKRLEKKGVAELICILKKMDAGRAKTVDPLNPRRIIRAIEIAKALGSVPIFVQQRKYDTLWIGVATSIKKLKALIKERLQKRLRSGLIEEAKRLHRRGLSWRRFYQLGLEYKFLADYLREKITKEDMIFKLEYAIYAYAKRQKTWFKKNPEILWITNASQANRLIEKFLKDGCH